MSRANQQTVSDIEYELFGETVPSDVRKRRRQQLTLEPWVNASIPGVSAGLVDSAGRLLPTAGDVFPVRFNKPPVLAGINQFLMHGQSPGEGAYCIPAISTSPLYSNLMFDSGVLTRPPPSRNYVAPTAFLPLVEHDDDPNPPGVGETPVFGAVNTYSKLLLDRYGWLTAYHLFLGSSAARGGQNIATLTSSGDLTRVLNQMAAGKALARQLLTNWSCQGTMWEQGEADVTTTFTTYATLLDRYQQKIQRWAAILSGVSSWLPLFATICNDQAVAGTQGSLRGLLEARNRNANIIIIAAKYAFSYPQNSNPLMQSDCVHSTALGSYLRGCFYSSIFDEVINRGNRAWRALELLSVKASGADLFLKFNVPNPPIELNTTLMGSVANSGIRATDSTGILTINSVTVQNHDTLKVSCNRTFGGTGPVGVGLYAGYTNYTASNAGATNICDAQKLVVTYGGNPYDLRHWAIPMDKTLTTHYIS